MQTTSNRGIPQVFADEGEAFSKPWDFSFFDSVRHGIPSCRMGLYELIEKIKGGEWRSAVGRARLLRETGGEDAYKTFRVQQLPAVSLSAVMKTRKAPETHSGLLQLDFDQKDHLGKTIEEIRKIVMAAPFTVACFLSLSGDGVKGIALCEANLQRHEASWLAAEEYFRRKGLVLDPSTKDLGRLCFVSDDPQAFLDLGASEIEPLKIDSPTKGPNLGGKAGKVTEAHAKRVIAEIARRNERPDYPDWLKISSAVFDGLGVEIGTEILAGVWPEEKRGEYEELAQSLPIFAPWDSLRAYLRGSPVDTREIETSGTDLLNKAYALKFTPEKVPPPDETSLLLGEDYPIASKGNLTGIQGKSKAGKSAVVSAILAAALLGDRKNEGDRLGFSWKGTSAGAVVHVDTEQSPSDWHALVRRGFRRSGLENSERLVSFPLVLFSRAERMKILRGVLKREVIEKGSIDLVIVDGIADLCTSPNDEAEALALVSELLAMSHEFNVPIVCIIHENPGSDSHKTRGHLGSELNRKAFANLIVDKESTTGISTMYGTEMRKRDIPKDHGFCFEWDEALGMHGFRGRADGVKAQEKRESALLKLREEWLPVFKFAWTGSDCPELTPQEAVDLWAAVHGQRQAIKEGALRKRMERAETVGFLRKAAPGKWTLNEEAGDGQFGHELDKRDLSVL